MSVLEANFLFFFFFFIKEQIMAYSWPIIYEDN